ncbi:MAG: hypothetical protein MJY87_08870 [Fibrobacter sp.]|nr:hypothetical protein [Fibrobacter sp.]
MKISSFLAGLAVGAIAAVVVSKKLNSCDCDEDCEDQDEASCEECETEKA